MIFLFYLQIYLWYSFCSVFEKDLDYWNIDPYSIGDNVVIRIVNNLTIDLQRLAVLSSTFLRWTSARMRRTWTWAPRSRRWRPRRRRTSGTVPSGRRRQGEGGRMIWVVVCSEVRSWLWNTLEYPWTSRLAQLLAFFSLSMIVLSTLTFIISTADELQQGASNNLQSFTISNVTFNISTNRCCW